MNSLHIQVLLIVGLMSIGLSLSAADGKRDFDVKQQGYLAKAWSWLFPGPKSLAGEYVRVTAYEPISLVGREAVVPESAEGEFKRNAENAQIGGRSYRPINTVHFESDSINRSSAMRAGALIGCVSGGALGFLLWDATCLWGATCRAISMQSETQNKLLQVFVGLAAVGGLILGARSAGSDYYWAPLKNQNKSVLVRGAQPGWVNAVEAASDNLTEQ